MVDTGVAAAVLQRGNLTREMCVALLGTHAIDKVANRDLKVSGGRWLTGPLRDARRPPSTLLYPVLRPFSVAPCQTLESRFASFATVYRRASRGVLAPLIEQGLLDVALQHPELVVEMIEQGIFDAVVVSGAPRSLERPFFREST
jgi:hypothetical protein